MGHGGKGFKTHEQSWWREARGGKADGLKIKRRRTLLKRLRRPVSRLEVMLNAMRELWEERTPQAKREAARIAKDAAPYVHPRLTSIDPTNNRELQRYVIYAPEPCLTTEEWEARVKAAGLKAAELELPISIN